ncbi:hypothetical protein [Methanocaldococcus sp.]
MIKIKVSWEEYSRLVREAEVSRVSIQQVVDSIVAFMPLMEPSKGLSLLLAKREVPLAIQLSNVSMRKLKRISELHGINYEAIIRKLIISYFEGVENGNIK